MTGEPLPRALVRLAGRNRCRYGGYVVHAGIAVLFLGVAASSAFIQQRDVRLAPGESTRTGDYTLSYERVTADLGADRAGTGAPISIGAVVRVRKGDQARTMRPARNFYPARDASQGPIGPISQFFEGEANSEVDVRWGLSRDQWLAIRPDVSALVPVARRLDRRLAASGPDTQARAVAALLRSTAATRRRPPSASSSRRWWPGSGSAAGSRCSERSWRCGRPRRPACAGSRRVRGAWGASCRGPSWSSGSP